MDVDAELARHFGRSTGRFAAGETPNGAEGATGTDPALQDEIREMVLARNYRRARAGKPPLDVEAEIARELKDLLR